MSRSQIMFCNTCKADKDHYDFVCDECLTNNDPEAVDFIDVPEDNSEEIHPLSCPFCGKPAQANFDPVHQHSVGCVNPGCPVASSTVAWESSQKAIGAWNTRHK